MTEEKARGLRQVNSKEQTEIFFWVPEEDKFCFLSFFYQGEFEAAALVNFGGKFLVAALDKT